MAVAREEIDLGYVQHMNDISTTMMHISAAVSLLCTTWMCMMLYKGRISTARKIFRAESAAGILLTLAFAVSVYYDKKAHEFSFPITAFIMSVLFVVTRMCANMVTAQNLRTPRKRPSNGAKEPRRKLLRLISIVLAASLVPLVTLASNFTDRKSAPWCLVQSSSNIDLPHAGELPHDQWLSILTVIAVCVQLSVVAMSDMRPKDKFGTRVRLAFTTFVVDCLLVLLLLLMPRLNSVDLTPWVKSFGWAIHEGDWCSTLFVTVSMFYAVAALFIIAWSSQGLSLCDDVEWMMKAYALFAETVALATVPPLLIIALGRMELEYKFTFLINAVPQIALLTMPYASHFWSRFKADELMPLL